MVDAILRQATDADLPEIASVHLAAYSRKHFTSRLPHGVLVNYYRLFLSDGAQTLVLLSGDKSSEAAIIGFAVFGRNIEDKIKQFKKENAIAIARISIRHPVAAGRKLLRNLWTKARHGAPMPSADYLLLSIAVSRQGMGAGRQLMNAFVGRARESGANKVGLYVNSDNVTAINTYVTKGFVVRQFYGGQFYMERPL